MDLSVPTIWPDTICTCECHTFWTFLWIDLHKVHELHKVILYADHFRWWRLGRKGKRRRRRGSLPVLVQWVISRIIVHCMYIMGARQIFQTITDGDIPAGKPMDWIIYWNAGPVIGISHHLVWTCPYKVCYFFLSFFLPRQRYIPNKLRGKGCNCYLILYDNFPMASILY